jgi:hypothetical protein
VDPSDESFSKVGVAPTGECLLQALLVLLELLLLLWVHGLAGFVLSNCKSIAHNGEDEFKGPNERENVTQEEKNEGERKVRKDVRHRDDRGSHGIKLTTTVLNDAKLVWGPPNFDKKTNLPQLTLQHELATVRDPENRKSKDRRCLNRQQGCANVLVLASVVLELLGGLLEKGNFEQSMLII